MSTTCERKTAVMVGVDCALNECICEMLSAQGIEVFWLMPETGQNEDARERRNILAYSDTASLMAQAQTVFDAQGSVDYLLFCALDNARGINRTALPDMTPEDWKRCKAQGINGMYDVSRAFLGKMAARRCGRVLAIGTLGGVLPVMGQDAYSATSAALFMLIQAIAVEEAEKGVVANALALGPIDASLGAVTVPADDALLRHIPLRRVCAREEILEAVRFLLLQAPEYLTGSVIKLDGALSGAYMRDW